MPPGVLHLRRHLYARPLSECRRGNVDVVLRKHIMHSAVQRNVAGHSQSFVYRNGERDGGEINPTTAANDAIITFKISIGSIQWNLDISVTVRYGRAIRFRLFHYQRRQHTTGGFMATM